MNSTTSHENCDKSLNRRSFIRTATSAASGLCLASDLPSFGQQAVAPEYDSSPDWFQTQRVQLHFKLANADANLKVARAVARVSGSQVTGRVFVRHVKSNDMGTFWPTRSGGAINTPYASYGMDGNSAKQMVDDAHANGCKMIGYFWDASDSVSGIDSIWHCRDKNNNTLESADGNDDGEGRGRQVCFNYATYRQIVTDELQELVKYRVDGIFFDWRHMPACYCPNCRGTYPGDIPNPTSTFDRTSRLIDFIVQTDANQTIQNTFSSWRSTVRRTAGNLTPTRDDVILIVSSSSVAGLSTFAMSTELFPQLDSNKAEWETASRSAGQFDAPDILPPQLRTKMSFGWSLLRDGTQGRPPHIWVAGLGMKKTGILRPPTERISHTDATLYEEQRKVVMMAVSALLAHGCIANLNSEPLIDRSGDVAINIADSGVAVSGQLFKQAFDLADILSPLMIDARPLAWVAVHFSERGRRSVNLSGHIPWPDVWADVWKTSTCRSYWAYHALVTNHYPVKVVADHDLEQGGDALDGVQVLFLPNQSALSERQTVTIQPLINAGRVYVSNPAADWSSPGNNVGVDLATRDFISYVRSLSISPPYRIAYNDGSPGAPPCLATSFVCNSGRRLMIFLVNDFSVVKAESPGATLTGAITRHPAVKVFLRNQALTGVNPWPAKVRTIRVLTSTQRPSVTIIDPPPFGIDFIPARNGTETAVTVPVFDFLAVVIFDYLVAP